jgi:hypothetical protein
VITAVGDSYGWLEEVLDASPDGLVVFCVTWDAVGRVAGLTVEYMNAAGDAPTTPTTASCVTAPGP